MRTLDTVTIGALQKKQILAAVLFGSTASGKTHKKSDVDIAILAQKPISFKERYNLQVIFTKAFGVPVQKIDIVDIRAANPLLFFMIMTEGEPLFGLSDIHDSLYVSAVKRHIDAKPLYQLDKDYVRSAH